MKANTVECRWMKGDTAIGGDPEAIAAILRGLLKAGRAPAKEKADVAVTVKQTRSGQTRWMVTGTVVAVETAEKEPRK